MPGNLERNRTDQFNQTLSVLNPWIDKISIEFGNRTLSNSNNVRTFYVRTTDLYNQASVQTEVFLKGGSIYLIRTWDEKLRSK